jgi:tetratricopeptide (TPR) repeat protein
VRKHSLLRVFRLVVAIAGLAVIATLHPGWLVQAVNFAIPVKPLAQVLSAAKEKVKSKTPDPEEEARALRDPAFAKAKASEQKKEYFEMLEEAKELSKTHPRSALAQRVLSDAYYYLNMMDDSMAAIKRAIDLDPSNARGWNDLAILYKRAGDSENAEQVYTHALKLAPDDAKLLILLSFDNRFTTTCGSNIPNGFNQMANAPCVKFTRCVW